MRPASACNRRSAAPGYRRHDAAVLDAVAASPLFEGLTLERIADLLERFDEQSFRAGQRILLEGRKGWEFFLIVDGHASILYDGWPVIDLHHGECFGEVGVLGDGHRLASVQARTPLRALVLANGDLEQLILDEPQVGVNLLRHLVRRFRLLSTARPARARTVLPV
jgi:CRP-like cAMP-binding protein